MSTDTGNAAMSKAQVRMIELIDRAKSARGDREAGELNDTP